MGGGEKSRSSHRASGKPVPAMRSATGGGSAARRRRQRKTFLAVLVLRGGVGIPQNLLRVLRRSARTVASGICCTEISADSCGSLRYVPALHSQRGPDERWPRNSGGGRSGRDSPGAVGR